MTEDPQEEKSRKDLLRDDIAEALADLPEQQKTVLINRFGLEDGVFQTLEEVGKKLNLSRERVRQIEKEALRALRHYPRPFRCSFCSASLPGAQRIFMGQAAKVCLPCLRKIDAYFEAEQPDPAKHNYVCYFCDIKQSEAGHLYLSPQANICPRCVKRYLDQS